MTFNESADVAQATLTTAAMMQARRWLISRDKVPHYIDESARTGPQNTPDDLARLATYNEALAACSNGGGWELGFALGFDGEGHWQGIDLDKISDKGLTEVADTLPGYVEYSRSKAGRHAIGYGRAFKNLGGNETGIEAYSTSQFFVTTTDVIKDGPLVDLSSFVEGCLAPLHKRGVKQHDAGTIGNIDAATVNDVRDAMTFLSSEKHVDWIAVGHSLKTMGASGYGLWIEYSKRSDKFDQQEADSVWNSFNPTNTSYKAVLAKAQLAGWKNPGRFYGISTPSPFQFAKSRFTLLGAAALESLPPIEWRVKGILPAQGVAVIYGASGAGKSFLALDQACAIAQGKDWFGHRVKAAPVLYLGLEGQAGFRNRVRAWKTVHGNLPEPLGFILDPFELNNPEAVDELAKVCEKAPGIVIYIDTLNRAASGADENTSEGMGALIDGATRLQRATCGAVVIISHTGKEAHKGIRGHSSLIAALDASILVIRNAGSDVRTWRAEKVKDGEDGIDHRFRLGVIPIGRDEDNDEITSCVIARDHGTYVERQSKPLSPSQSFALQTFHEAAGVAGKLDDEGNFVGLHVEDWRTAFYRNSTHDKEDAKRQAFSRARKELTGPTDVLAVENDVYRLAGPNAVAGNAAFAALLKSVTA